MTEAFLHRIVFLEAVGLPEKPVWKSIAEFIFLLVVFILILIACVITTRFVAGQQMQRGRNGNFKPIETYQVAQNRYLQLVQIGTRFFVISVTKDNISLICELKEDEFEHKDETNTRFSKSFKELLSDLRVKVDKHDDTEK